MLSGHFSIFNLLFMYFKNDPASTGRKRFLSGKAFAWSLLMWLITLTITAYFTGIKAIMAGKVPQVLVVLGALYVVIVRFYFKTVSRADTNPDYARNNQFESGLLQLGLLLMPFITCFSIYYNVKTGCPQENTETNSIVFELIDSTDQYLQTNITLRVMDENCQAVSNRVRNYQEQLLNRLMTRRGIPESCRVLYADTIHRIVTEYSSIVCHRFEELEQFCQELNNIVQNKDAGAIPFLFRKYNMQWETKAVEIKESQQLVARGNLQSYITDQIQELIPAAGFRAIWMRREGLQGDKINEVIFIKS